MGDPTRMILEDRSLLAEIQEVIRITKAFGISDNDDKVPPTFFRKKKAPTSKLSIKNTISRDRNERELPEVSFTSADLGGSLLVAHEADRVAVVGGATKEDLKQQEFTRSGDTVSIFGEGMDTAEESWSSVTGHGGGYRSVGRPLRVAKSKIAIYPNQSADKEKPPSNQWPWTPSRLLRRRHSSPDLGTARDMEKHPGQVTRDRTYLEPFTGNQLFGRNPASNFFSFLIDEINKLEMENHFLRNQLSPTYNKIYCQRPDLTDQAVKVAPEFQYYKTPRERERLGREFQRGDEFYDDTTSPSASVSSYEGLGNKRAEVVIDSPMPLSPHLDADPQPPQIYHKVICRSRYLGHGKLYCLEPPTRPPVSAQRETQKQHLQENAKVSGLDSILKRSTGASFIVVKSYDCAKTSRRWRLKHTSQATESPKGTMMAEVDDNESSPIEEYILITSKILQDALENVAQCAYGEKDDMPQPKLAAPYLFIYHHRSLLKKHALERKGPVEKAINHLLDYFQKNFGRDYEEADRLFKRGLVSSEHLLKLFRPNTLLYSSNDGCSSALAIACWPTGYFNNLNLQCWSWKYDGSLFQRDLISVEVFCEDNEPVPIRHLAIYPLEFAEKDVQDRLMTRGKKFWDFRFQGMVCYNGPSVDGTEEHVNTRFMIDDPLHRKYHPTSRGLIGLNHTPPKKMDPFDKWPLECSRTQLIDEDTLPLMPDKLRGFNLHSKEWEEIYVDGISRVQWYKKAFDRLVLPRRTKDLIKAMVVNRKRDKSSSDIFYGKGKGLIMLLHGGPGTGKTLSAESVAELAEKPLYRVTCGDIGTEVDDVERYLEEILSLGKRWDCVLLLDEADVFLEERSLADLKRNSLVSVFLRVLEYYEGILILTSNRVGIFDEAFKSRIQVALHYENLTKSSRKKIWSNFIEMLEEDEFDANISDLESHIDDLASVDMNGRQIRNAMTTAKQLSMYKKQTLEFEHLEEVLKTAGDFNRYIEKVHGHQDDKWAREGGLR